MGKFLGVACLAVLTAGSALADTGYMQLDNVQGTVMVQNDGDFVAAANGDFLASNQQILVKPNSSAILQSDVGPCYFAIREPGLYNMPAPGVCVPGQVVVLSGAFNVLPTNGEPALVGASGSQIAPVLVAGGFVVVGASALYFSTTLEDEESPVSAP